MLLVLSHIKAKLSVVDQAQTVYSHGSRSYWIRMAQPKAKGWIPACEYFVKRQTNNCDMFMQVPLRSVLCTGHVK
jgi:hypothetical protein